MRDIRFERESENSDPDVSHDSGIYIPRRISPTFTRKERALRAARFTADEVHWKNVNKRHLESGIPAQTTSLRLTEAKTLSYRMGMVNGGWHVDQADKDNERLFPRPSQITNMQSDRIYADPYSAKLEYQVNDVSPELNALTEVAARRRVQIHAGELDIQLDCSSAYPGSHRIKESYSRTEGLRPNERDRTRMAASQQRKDDIYRRIDNYCYQQRRTPEEMAFANRSEQLKHDYHAAGHGMEMHNADRKNNRKASAEYALLYPGCPVRIMGNTLYAKLYFHDNVIQNFQLWPCPSFIRNGETDRYGRKITAQEYMRVKKAPDSRGLQFNVHPHLDCARSSDINPMLQITEGNIEILAEAASDEEKAAQMDPLDARMKVIGADKVPRPAIDRLMDDLKDIICRRRDANGEIGQIDHVPTGFGIGLPFILEMIRAQVAGNDLDDTNRNLISALYIGLTLGRKRSGTGLPLDSPAIETETGL